MRAILTDSAVAERLTNTAEPTGGDSHPQKPWSALPLVAVAVYLVGSLLIFAAILRRTHHTFTYVLDDPYIHLALAEQIAHGHYGINPGETTSPASSLLWPFLLVPFAGRPVHVYLPLLWNLLFGAATAWLIGWCVARWTMLRPRNGLLGARHLSRTKQGITAVLLVFIANLFTLTFVGMEHCLQVLLAAVCAWGIAEALSERPIPPFALAAAAVLPSVRYEGLGLTLAVAVALYGQRRRLAPSLLLLALSAAPLLAFSLFLHAHGLPLLPNSVMVKSQAATSNSGAVRAIRIMGGNVVRGVYDLEYWPAAILAVLLAHLWWHERTPERRWALGGAALAVALHVLVGRNGWFTRYEVYAVIFASLVLVRVLLERRAFLFGYFAIGLILIGTPYLRSTQRIAAAATDVYHQQYQMHRFITDFYRGNVAVNDIGYVSFARPANSYVLDLWGLATTEAATERHKNAAWLAGITTRHHADLAMIYPSWYDGIPQTWTPLGTLCLPNEPEALAKQCVVFYSTRSAATPALKQDAARFADQLPNELEFLPGVALRSAPD